MFHDNFFIVQFSDKLFSVILTNFLWKNLATENRFTVWDAPFHEMGQFHNRGVTYMYIYIYIYI